jgi:hypothetical protein
VQEHLWKVLPVIVLNRMSNQLRNVIASAIKAVVNNCRRRTAKRKVFYHFGGEESLNVDRTAKGLREPANFTQNYPAPKERNYVERSLRGCFITLFNVSLALQRIRFDVVADMPLVGHPNDDHSMHLVNQSTCCDLPEVGKFYGANHVPVIDKLTNLD